MGLASFGFNLLVLPCRPLTLCFRHLLFSELTDILNPRIEV